MRLRLYQIDAFTSTLFKGNPAAVVPLGTWLPDATLAAIAAENNLSETAFFVKEANSYTLRWFTPVHEASFCGHATLASAYVLFEELKYDGDTLHFETRVGDLFVRKVSQGFEMDFPTLLPEKVEQPSAELLDGLGKQPLEVVRNFENYFAIYRNASDVKTLEPDFTKLSRLFPMGVAVTAPGTNGIDFISRYFAPGAGIPEDPVTGSTHTTLVPYWSEKLGKTHFFAHQVSQRGGELWCELRGERVILVGQAVKYLEGTIFLESL